MSFDNKRPMPAPKTIVIYFKSGNSKIAVLSEHLQSNHDIGCWLQDNLPDFDHWCFADELVTKNNNYMPCNPTDETSPFHPTYNQTVVIDTVRSLMFWIRPVYNNKYRLVCSNYIIHENIILAPPVKTEDFDDIKSAWAALLEIKRKPHMAFMTVTNIPSYRMFNKATDAQLLMLPALDHIEYLEKQIADMRPALDAYKRTGWEPCDYNSLSYYKDRAERLTSENEELKSQLAFAIKAKEHADEERATLIAMMNSQM